MIAYELNLNHQTVHEILMSDLNMRKICAKMVPKILTQEQKEKQKNVCFDLLERTENDTDFMKSVIIGDESWIF